MQHKSLGKIIGTIHRQQQIILNNKFEEYGIGSGQYSFYLAVAENEGLNQKELSQLLNVNKATTNKAIKKLESLGYVETRIDKDDRRLHCVYLTDKGSQLRPEIKKHLRAYTTKLGDNLPEEEEEVFFRCLELVEKNIKS